MYNKKIATRFAEKTYGVLARDPVRKCTPASDDDIDTLAAVIAHIEAGLALHVKACVLCKVRNEEYRLASTMQFLRTNSEAEMHCICKVVPYPHSRLELLLSWLLI